MKKVFLYLYPIEEFSRVFFLGNDYYDEMGDKRPFDVLNDAIQKRYRDNGYQVVFALYPDKKNFGILCKEEDKIIFTDISFEEASGYNEDETKKPYDEIKYPNEQFLINQLGEVDELVVGGYHAQDCVKKVAETALDNNIDTLVDLDMTDLFFALYRRTEYFEVDSYAPERFKKHMIKRSSEYGVQFAEELFSTQYQSPVYGFDNGFKKAK